MDIDKIKTLSEIFNNFAQPIATIIASLVAAKVALIVAKSRRKWFLPSYLFYYITFITMKPMYILIVFAGIAMTLNKDLCWIGIALMVIGMIAYAKED